MSAMDASADGPAEVTKRAKAATRTQWISWVALAMMTTSSGASLRAAPTMAVDGLACVFLYTGTDWKPDAGFVKWAEGLPDGNLRAVMVPLSHNLTIFTNAGEGLLFQVATSLRAEARWGALLGELIEGGEPLGALGREHAAWLVERGLRPTTAASA